VFWNWAKPNKASKRPLTQERVRTLAFFPGNCNPSALGVVAYPNFAPATKFNLKTPLTTLMSFLYNRVFRSIR